VTGGGGLGGLGTRAGAFFSSPPPAKPFALPFPNILEVGVAAVPGEEEREPGEAPVASGSRKDTMEDSRRREGILDCDLAPGLLLPTRERGVADTFCFFVPFVGEDSGEPGRFRFDKGSPSSLAALTLGLFFGGRPFFFKPGGGGGA